jgi:hypothetical protein
VNVATADAGGPDNAPVVEDQKLLALCKFSSLKTFSVDNVNVGLYGTSSPFYTQRGQAIPQHIAARTSDVMCLTEADDKAYRTAIQNAVTTAKNYPNVYMVDTTPSTPPSDPDDVVPPPSVPPCGGTVDQTTVQNAYSCLLNNCGTTADPTTAVLNESTTCVSRNCAVPLAKLLHPGKFPSDGANIAADQACLTCIIITAQDGVTTMSASQNQCTKQSQDAFAFNGQTANMILSKYPLTNTSYYVLPSTAFRRVVLKAQVQLEDQAVDFFCTQLSGPTVPLLQYTGHYGKSLPSGENGWEDEQDLQVKRAIAWVKSEADKDGVPAVFAGDWDASPGTTEADGGVGLTATSPEVPQLMDSTFALAVPPSYVPICDYCSSNLNPYNKQPETYQLLREYTYKFPTNAALSETLWGTTPDISITGTTLDPAPPGGLGTIGEYFAHNVVLLRPR